MPERFALYEIEKLTDRFALPGGLPAGVKKNYNNSPAELAPVVVVRDGVRVIEQKMWGFLPATAKDTRSIFRYKTTEAKSEEVFYKATWSGVIRTQRCLVPVNGYYEWRKTIDGKRPFYVQLKNHPLMALAGIYSTWTDPSGKEQGTFAIVTIADNSHTGRSPVIIAPDGEADWLSPDISDLGPVFEMMLPLANDMLKSHQVTTDLKNVKLNSPALIAPAE